MGKKSKVQVTHQSVSPLTFRRGLEQLRRAVISGTTLVCVLFIRLCSVRENILSVTGVIHRGSAALPRHVNMKKR